MVNNYSRSRARISICEFDRLGYPDNSEIGKLLGWVRVADNPTTASKQVTQCEPSECFAMILDLISAGEPVQSVM